MTDVQSIADYLFEETTKLNAPISYTACLVLAKHVLGTAQNPMIQRIEAEARQYAEMYQPSSDGRNTFIIFADWVSALSFPSGIREGKEC